MMRLVETKPGRFFSVRFGFVFLFLLSRAAGIFPRCIGSWVIVCEKSHRLGGSVAKKILFAWESWQRDGDGEIDLRVALGHGGVHLLGLVSKDH
jgi:hypothetical protein